MAKFSGRLPVQRRKDPSAQHVVRPEFKECEIKRGSRSKEENCRPGFLRSRTECTKGEWVDGKKRSNTISIGGRGHLQKGKGKDHQILLIAKIDARGPIGVKKKKRSLFAKRNSSNVKERGIPGKERAVNRFERK